MPENRTTTHGHTVRYSLYGVLFGSCFPVLAALMERHQRGSSFWAALIGHDNPLSYIIDTAPLFLGLLAALAGRKQDKLEEARAGISLDLESSRRLLGLIIDSIPAALFCKDYGAGGTFVEWNKAAEETWGLTRSQVLGKTDLDLFPLEQAQGFREKDLEILRSGEAAYIPQERISSPKKGLIDVRTWKVPVRGQREAGPLLLGISLDISEQVRADRMLQETRNLLEQQQIALDESSIVTISGVDGQIIYANKKFIEASGYSEAEVIGQSHRIVSSGHHPPHFFANLWSTLHAGQVWKGEIRNKSKDGRAFWVDTTIVPVRGIKGEITHYASIQQDVTRRKEIEQELRIAREKALAATRTKSAFLANMSHEIRTPMNGILGMCNLLEETVNDPDAKEKLRIIQSCGSSLLELINDVLDFSKLEAEKLTLAFEPLPLKRVIQEVVTLYLPKAREKGVSLLHDPDPGTPEWVMGDATRLRQVLSNLVSNAIKFTEKGEIRIRSRAEDHPSGHRVSIAVSDTGIGVPAEMKGLLFQAFSQVDGSTTRKFGGTGLGLAISKGLCERMGGSVSLEANPGGGSTFQFSIIVGRSSGAAAEEKKESSWPERAGGLPLSILVAEDNKVNQVVLMGYLKKLGYSADLAANGKEAIERARQKCYDIILMDCHMPEMDGFEATRQILASRTDRQRHQRIVAVTAGNSQDQISRCVACGMDEVLSKPLVLAELAAALSRVAGERSRADEAGPRPSLEILSSPDVMLRFRGMEDVAKSMFEAFIEAAPERMARILSAIEAGDAAALRLAAHTLRGSLSYFDHGPSLTAVAELEQIGKDGSLGGARRAYDALSAHLADLLEGITLTLRSMGKAA